MGKEACLKLGLALIFTLAVQALCPSVNASLSASEVSIDAIRAAEERVAAERGMTVEELRSKITNECFARIQDQHFEESSNGLFTSQDARYAAENGCANLAIVGPSDIESSE